MSIDQAFVLLLDGVDVAFWSREDARDALSPKLPHATHHPGLVVPATSTSCDLKTGALDSTSASFTINDTDDTLAALFAAVRTDSDTMSGGSLLPTDQDSTYENKHIGTEAMGTSGARRQYAALPSVGTYGDFHPSQQITDIIGQQAVAVDTGPSLFSGRRLALYRFTKPRGPGDTWANSVTQTELRTAANLVWWGTLRDSGSVTARTWKLQADGPQSLLRRQLNASSFSEGITIAADLALLDEEKWIGAAVSIVAESSSTFKVFQYGKTAPSQQSVSDTSVSAAQAISGIIDTTIAASDPTNGEFTDITDGDGFAKMYDTGNNLGAVTIRTYNRNGSDTYTSYTDGYAVLRVVAHERLWRAIGYDVFQAGNWPNSDERLVRFTAVSTFLDTALPSSGYYAATFDSWPTNIERDGSGPAQAEIGLESSRTHRPSAGVAAGVHVLNTKLGAGQEITLAGGLEDVAVLPALDHPIASDDGASGTTGYTLTATCDAQRAFLFYGPFRATGEDDERDIGQIGRCSWVEQSVGVMASEQMVLTQWHDPRLYGVKNGKLEGDWAANVDAETGIRVLPLAHLGFSCDGWDNRGDVCQALLLGSGTSTGWWTTSSHTTRTYGPGSGYIAPGQNNPGSALSLGSEPLDRVGVDIGCDIPKSLVAGREAWEQLTGDLDPTLAGVKVAWVGPMTGDDIMRGIMQPVGWALTLRDGKYTPMVPTRVWSPSDADVTITAEELIGNRRGAPEIPRQGLRHRAAIDSVTFNWRWDPLRAEHWGEHTIMATDPGARYRSGAAKMSIDANWERFDRGPDKPQFRRLWDRIFRWWAQRHFEVQDLRIIQAGCGENLWPGTVVRLTDPWLVSQDGTYGVTGAIGIVTSVTQEWAKGETRATVMVQEPPRDGYLIHAPEARAYKYDSGTYTLYCEGDFRGIGGGHVDVAAFEQPSWSASAVAGASIKVLQFVRGSLYQTLTGTISSVDSSANTITLTGALSGTYYRDMDSIVLMREYSNQSAAWVKEVFAAIADEDGLVDGSATNAQRFNDA